MYVIMLDTLNTFYERKPFSSFFHMVSDLGDIYLIFLELIFKLYTSLDLIISC